MKTFVLSQVRLVGAAMSFLLLSPLPAADRPASEIVGLGVVAPRNVVLSEQRPLVSRHFTVVIENRGARSEVIRDAASLAELVALDLAALGADAPPRAVLVPPRSFPITLRPRQKLAVVFRVTFALGDAPGAPAGFQFAATVDRAPLASPAGAMSGLITVNGTGAPTAGAGIIRRGADKGATVTAKPMKVALKKGKTSDPISFSAKWPGKSFFVSGWEGSPTDEEADKTLSKSQSPSVTARWKNPGIYTVTAFLYHLIPGGGFEPAAPSEEIRVIGVEFKDEMGNDPEGMNVGVTTSTADRSRTLTANVTPASETNSVMLKVTKGGSALAIKDINPGNGTITFKVEGIGKTGSAAKNDCTIEAQVEGKDAGKVNMTVVVPKKLRQTLGTASSRNLQANSGTSPAFPGAQGPLLAIVETFYFVPVTVTVSDQFGQPIVDPGNPKLYLGAPVFEAFQVKGKLTTAAPINLTIGASSDYVDPVGVQIWQNWPAPPRQHFYNPLFNPAGPPLFAFPELRPPQLAPEKTDIFQAQVDGFPLEPIVTRTLRVELGGVLSLLTTP